VGKVGSQSITETELGEKNCYCFGYRLIEAQCRLKSVSDMKFGLKLGVARGPTPSAPLCGLCGMLKPNHFMLFIFSYSIPFLIYDLLGRFGTDIEFNIVGLNIGNYITFTQMNTEQTVVVGLQNEYQAMNIVRGEVKCTENTTTDMCK
jgi:hypothetical protein